MSELERQEKLWDLSEAKADDTGSGSFSGYASVFNVKDLGGDVVLPGAFADTIPQFVRTGFIPWGHDWKDKLPVGMVAAAAEDERGLYITAKFHSTPEGQSARTTVRERLADGHFMGLSIGYVATDADYTPDARLLKKIHLFETSLVTVPMNPAAGVIAAKSAEVPHAAEAAATPDPERSAGVLLAALERLVAAPDAIDRPQLDGLLKRARDLVRVLEKAAAPPPDDLAAIAAAFRDFQALHPPSAPSGPVRLHGGR